MISTKDLYCLISTIVMAIVIMVIGIRGVYKNRGKKYKSMPAYAKADYIYSLSMIIGSSTAILSVSYIIIFGWP